MPLDVGSPCSAPQLGKHEFFHRLSSEPDVPIGGHVAVLAALVIIGFDPNWVVFVVLLNLGLQFFVHTQAIKRLGPLEWIFNTPSHHRVHHGRNPQYIDKNYAGVLIIWDRLFGSFEPERETVRYGITNRSTALIL